MTRQCPYCKTYHDVVKACAEDDYFSIPCNACLVQINALKTKQNKQMVKLINKLSRGEK